MIERFKEDWYRKICQSDRYSSYRQFKSSHEAEKYVNDVTIKKFRDSLVRFRLGVNELGINKRFSVPNYSTKICPFCPNIFEDEEHSLFNCPVYSDIRHKYLRHMTGNDIECTLNVLFRNNTVQMSRNLAMYVYYALKLREENMTV